MTNKKINLQKNYENFISSEIKSALDLCSKLADNFDIPIFLIGGVVRDLVLEKKSFDTDITIQSNAIDFAKKLTVQYPEICSLISIHDDFKTAKIQFLINNKKINLDIASTRKENYPNPASLPVVSNIGCNITDDIKRRDFTINSMALSLNKSNFCDLIDPLNGFDDLKNGLIKIIHTKSFIDDPTRIIRALKFSVRFNFKLDNQTKKIQDECIKSELFNNLGTERLKSEIKQTFNLNNEKCFDYFIKEKLYTLINSKIIPTINGTYIKQNINDYKTFINKDFIWLIYLSCLFSDLNEEKISEISDKLNLNGKEKLVLIATKSLYDKKELLINSNNNFEVYELLKNKPIESILAFKLLQNNTVLDNKIDLFIKKTSSIKLSISGNDLLNKGLKSGPDIGLILKEILKAKINNEIKSTEEELNLALKLINMLK